ncbi:MAG: GNAT family N-acetyltransferase [archaeon]|nr:MAG: GNAT family N-acetyltransferase [archaeon]
MIRGRLVDLRALEKEDLPMLHRLQNDEEVMGWARFRPDHFASMESLQKEYEKELAGDSDLRRTFIILEKTSGKVAGWCSLRWWRAFHTTADFGIAMDKDFRGKGFGTEVLRLLTRTAFEQYNMHKVELFTRYDNEAMMHAAEKNGFKVEGTHREGLYFDGKYHDGVSMGVLREEFERANATP